MNPQPSQPDSGFDLTPDQSSHEEIARRAATAIARNTDRASISQRWMFEEYIAEVQQVILSAITEAQAGREKSPRIYTRCPACGNDTLTINDDKHLLCTWIECPDPTLIDRAAPPQPRPSEDAGTPRTDEWEIEVDVGSEANSDYIKVIRSEYARTLESELSALQSQRASDAQRIGETTK